MTCKSTLVTFQSSELNFRLISLHPWEICIYFFSFLVWGLGPDTQEHKMTSKVGWERGEQNNGVAWFWVSKTRIGRRPTGASDCVNWHRDLPELYAVARKTNPQENGWDTCNTLDHHIASLATAIPSRAKYRHCNKQRMGASFQWLRGVFRP
jgi:hypothetical protein